MWFWIKRLFMKPTTTIIDFTDNWCGNEGTFKDKVMYSKKYKHTIILKNCIKEYDIKLAETPLCEDIIRLG